MRRIMSLALLATVAVALASCSFAPAPEPPQLPLIPSYPPEAAEFEIFTGDHPDSLALAADSDRIAAIWTADSTLLVVSGGSGSCPWIPSTIAAPGPSSLALSYSTGERKACTDDLNWVVHEFTVPAEWEIRRPASLTIEFDYAERTTTETVDIAEQ